MLAPFVTRQLDVDAGDGLRLRVVSGGTGAPLLLLHGFTGSAHTWASLCTSLGDRFTVHAVDLPGHGGSSAPDDPARYALGSLAGDLARVLDVLDVRQAAVLGYSLGGRAALRFALDHPARVSALVLESTSAGIADTAERTARRAADHGLAETIERDGIERFVEYWEALPLWESQAALAGSVREALRAQRLANSPCGLANSLRGAGAGAEPPLTGRLGAIDIPVLLVAGALDAKYVALGRLMEQAMPRARLAVVEGAGHAVHLERPDAFAALVAEFLDAVR